MCSSVPTPPSVIFPSSCSAPCAGAVGRGGRSGAGRRLEAGVPETPRLLLEAGEREGRQGGRWVGGLATASL